jgi:hypothetical protein
LAVARPVLQGRCWLCYSERRCPLAEGCTLGAVDDIVRDNRGKLAALLRGREGWHLGVQDGTQGGEEYWGFGVDGASRLTILAEADGFLLAIHDGVLGDARRDSWVIPRIESVGKWLDEHEAEHAGLTPLQEEFKRYLGQEEPGP